MIHYLDEINFASCYHLATSLDVGPHSRQNELWIYLTVAFDQSITQLSWHKHTTWITDLYIVS